MKFTKRAAMSEGPMAEYVFDGSTP